MTINDWVNTYLTTNNIILILILFIILLTVIIIFLIFTSLKNNDYEKDNSEVKKEFNINNVTKELEKNMDKERLIRVDEYENEQEQKAIISYDELLKNASSFTINYDDENSFDGVKVRKVELEKGNNEHKEMKTPEVENRSFYTYEREEEFLKALKQFRANL